MNPAMHLWMKTTAYLLPIVAVLFTLSVSGHVPWFVVQKITTFWIGVGAGVYASPYVSLFFRGPKL